MKTFALRKCIECGRNFEPTVHNQQRCPGECIIVGLLRRHPSLRLDPSFIDLARKRGLFVDGDRKVCLECGKPIDGYHQKRYCNEACQHKHWYKQQSEKVKKYCKQCGSSILRIRRRAFCNDDCRKAYQKEYHRLRGVARYHKQKPEAAYKPLNPNHKQNSPAKIQEFFKRSGEQEKPLLEIIKQQNALKRRSKHETLFDQLVTKVAKGAGTNNAKSVEEQIREEFKLPTRSKSKSYRERLREKSQVFAIYERYVKK